MLKHGLMFLRSLALCVVGVYMYMHSTDCSKLTPIALQRESTLILVPLTSAMTMEQTLSYTLPTLTFTAIEVVCQVTMRCLTFVLSLMNGLAERACSSSMHCARHRVGPEVRPVASEGLLLRSCSDLVVPRASWVCQSCWYTLGIVHIQGGTR